MSIARPRAVRDACFAAEERSAWLAANDSARGPRATAAAADKPAFSNFRRDSSSAQPHPSEVFIDLLLDSAGHGFLRGPIAAYTRTGHAAGSTGFNLCGFAVSRMH